jgi:hypothetical protein
MRVRRSNLVDAVVWTVERACMIMTPDLACVEEELVAS